MDIERLIQSRALRSTRDGRPFKTFYAMYSEVLKVEQTNWSKIAEIRWVLEKQSVITMITAVEVYFRDMLDHIFRVCKPESFRPALKEIHKAKYDIDELLDMHIKNIHPLELVADSFNFQNTTIIFSVYSKLIKKSLWESVKAMKVRVKDKPETEVGFGTDLLASFERSLRLRHELIHNPDLTRNALSPNEWADLHATAGLILGCDAVLNAFISENLDEEFKQRK